MLVMLIMPKWLHHLLLELLSGWGDRTSGGRASGSTAGVGVGQVGVSSHVVTKSDDSGEDSTDTPPATFRG